MLHRKSKKISAKYLDKSAYNYYQGECMDKAVKTFFADKEQVNIDTSLALRFLRVRKAPDKEMSEMVLSCVNELENEVCYKACYRYFDITIDEDVVSFDDCMKLKSEKLSRNLKGCKGAFVFVATTSLSVDRLIHKYKSTQVSKALVIDAIGSAAVEAFCNYLCDEIQNKYGVSFRPRFSPGYGDLDICTQKDVLSACDCTKKIGVTLNSNFMMIPTKTVSAIAGIRPKNEKCEKSSNCENCDATECPYRE